MKVQDPKIANIYFLMPSPCVHIPGISHVCALRSCGFNNIIIYEYNIINFSSACRGVSKGS